jgi:hypothetical protein
MNNAGIRPLIFESLFVTPPFALGRDHADLLQHAHEIVEEMLFHDLALLVQCATDNQPKTTVSLAFEVLPYANSAPDLAVIWPANALASPFLPRPF